MQYTLLVKSLIQSLLSAGIAPRLLLATLPAPLGVWSDGWMPSCFLNESLLCQYLPSYFFYPPLMDVLFALLVLAPFISKCRGWQLRVLGLIGLSIIVHAASVAWLVGSRGSIELAMTDSLFLNVIPIALMAGLVTVGLSALIAGFFVTRWLWVLAALASLPVGAVFVFADYIPIPELLLGMIGWPWPVWHVSICAAIFYGIKRDKTTSENSHETSGHGPALNG